MFLPPTMFGFSKLTDVAGPAVMVSVSKYGNSFLVPPGDDPSAIMLDGPHAGHFIRRSEGEHFEGMSIAGVEIEVDHDSAYVVRGLDRPLLSVVRHLGGVGIVAQNEHNFTGRYLPTVVWQGLELDRGADAIGFTTWRAVVKIGDLTHVLHEHKGMPVSRD